MSSISKGSMSSNWFQRLTRSTKEPYDEKQHLQKIAQRAKHLYHEYQKKDKQNCLTRDEREKFLGQASDLWRDEILPYWQKYGLYIQKDLGKLWWYGLPPRIRGPVWKLTIGNDLGLTRELFDQFEMIAREKFNEIQQIERDGNADELLTSTNLLSHSNDNHRAYFQFIQLDVSRTFPQLGLFQKHGPYHEQLQILLCMYVYFSSDIGYVQGLAFLAAMFLLHLDLFDSFICFANLLNRRYFQAFYRIKHMDEYLDLFEQFLRVHLPKLSAHFAAMSIKADCFALDWFFTLFAKSLPLDVVVRLWDMFFRDGEVFIYRTALAILSMYEDHLCQIDPFHCLQFLTRLPDNLDSKELFSAIERIQLKSSDVPLYHLIA